MSDLADRVAEIGWYHTIELAPGVVTPGMFDLRGVVGRLPWPDVAGKRCLDVGTFDGYYAFELERRGAAEVVAIDLEDLVDLDWLPRERPVGMTRGDRPLGAGFQIAHEALGSTVRRVTSTVYELDRDDLGTFDVVVCGALLQHLREPFRALHVMRSLCAGSLLTVEHVDALTSLLFRRRPMLRLVGRHRTWTLPNVAGHRSMLTMAGFEIEASETLGMPFGPRFLETVVDTQRGAGDAMKRLGWRLLTGAPDPSFSALRVTPDPSLASGG